MRQHEIIMLSSTTRATRDHSLLPLANNNSGAARVYLIRRTVTTHAQCDKVPVCSAAFKCTAGPTLSPCMLTSCSFMQVQKKHVGLLLAAIAEVGFLAAASHDLEEGLASFFLAFCIGDSIKYFRWTTVQESLQWKLLVTSHTRGPCCLSDGHRLCSHEPLL